jgi:hypothetical protein
MPSPIPQSEVDRLFEEYVSKEPPADFTGKESIQHFAWRSELKGFRSALEMLGEPVWWWHKVDDPDECELFDFKDEKCDACIPLFRLPDLKG